MQGEGNMDNQKKNSALIKGTGIYAIGTFGTKMLSFFIVPIYTYYIATEDMGLYDILLSTVHLLAPIITMQISDAAYRYIIRSDNEPDHYIRNTVHVLVVNCSIAFALVFLVNAYYSIPYCVYFAFLLVSTRIMDTIQKLLRALRNQLLFAVSGIVYSVIILSLNVLQICILKTGIKGLFLSSIIASIVTIIVIFVFEPKLRINYFRKTDLGIVKKFYKFSAPLVPNYLNWWVINSSDRYIVAMFLGRSANGVLAIAHKFPTVLQLVLNLFTTSWQDLSVADKDQDIGNYNTKVFKQFYRVTLSFLWALIPLTKVFIFLIMSVSYKNACNYVAFYYIGTIFQSFSSFYGVGYLRSKNTGKAFTTSIYGAIVNAIINLALIKIIGLQAAAISTFIGFFVMWIIRERQNREELKIRIDKLEFILLLASSIIIAILSIHFSWAVNLCISAVGIIGFVVFNHSVLKLIIKKVAKKLIKK